MYLLILFCSFTKTRNDSWLVSCVKLFAKASWTVVKKRKSAHVEVSGKHPMHDGICSRCFPAKIANDYKMKTKNIINNDTQRNKQ